MIVLSPHGMHADALRHSGRPRALFLSICRQGGRRLSTRERSREAQHRAGERALGGPLTSPTDHEGGPYGRCHLSLSRFNHRRSGVQAHPDIVQGTAELHHEIADALLPQADPVFHDATARDTAMHVLAPQPPLGERLVGPLLLSRQLLPPIEINSINLRTRIKRLVRRTICFSKTEEMHDLVIGLFINRYEFGLSL